MSLGRALILVGVVLILLGLFLAGFRVGVEPVDKYLTKGFSLFRWIGHLPGDFVFHQNNTTFYVPITSSIVVSIGLTILFWALRLII